MSCECSDDGVDASGLRDAITALESGFLVVFPTDTVYGLAADPRVAGARDKLYEAKKREPRKPIPILISDSVVAERMGAVFTEAAKPS